MLLFGYLFVFAPILLYLFGASAYFLLCLAVPLPLMGAFVAFLFYRVHRAYYFEQTSDRIAHMLRMLLFPPGAARASVAITRGLLTIYHPLAVASMLCDRASYEALSRRALLELTYAIEPQLENEETIATGEYYRKKLIEILTCFSKEAGLDVAQFFQAPQHVEPSSKSYCPRCLCQYERTEGECADCAGVLLLPLNPLEQRKSIA